MPPRRDGTSNPVMFIGDEVRAEVSVAAATARLASLLAGTTLSTASHAAWSEGIARIGPAGPVPGLSKLVHVRVREPVQRGAVTVLALRWEAVGASERLFPVLDADITLIPDGDDATLIGLHGVYGPPAGSVGGMLDRAILHRIAAATIRSFLSRLASAIKDPVIGRARDAGGSVDPPVRARVDVTRQNREAQLTCCRERAATSPSSRPA